MASNKKPILIATGSYGYLAAAMISSGYFQAGKLGRGQGDKGEPLLEDKPYPDGERYHRLLTDVEGRKVVLVGGTIDDRETMELFDLANTLVDHGAQELKLVVPYYGYSTMERAIKDGEAVKAKYRARLLSAIPQAVTGNLIYLLDLHSEGIQHYFEGGLHARHVYAKPVVIESVKAMLVRDAGATTPAQIKAALERPFVFASTDAGRAKWVESLTSDMNKLGMAAQSAFIIKRRVSGSASEVRDISADVDDALVIIYDDMIRTGGSLLKAAAAYRDKGARSVSAIATHCLMPGATREKLAASGLISHIAVTDSHPLALSLQNDFLSVHTISNLLAEKVSKGRMQLA